MSAQLKLWGNLVSWNLGWGFQGEKAAGTRTLRPPMLLYFLSPPPAPRRAQGICCPHGTGYWRAQRARSREHNGPEWRRIRKGHQYPLRQANETVLRSWEWMEQTRRMSAMGVAQASALCPVQLLPSKWINAAALLIRTKCLSSSPWSCKVPGMTWPSPQAGFLETCKPGAALLPGPSFHATLPIGTHLRLFLKQCLLVSGDCLS